MTFLLCALFFASGAAALIFETLWFRQTGLVFGNGVWASSLVLASFMAGLALGNGLAARHAHRFDRPVRLYAVLEVVIAASGVALVYGLPDLAAALTPWLRPLRDTPALLNAVRLGLAFALLLVPATAMGATLPLLVGALRARDPSFGSALGRLYGWNTLGAVAGALVGELWGIERFGLRGTAWLAAGANLAAGVGALAVAGRFAAMPTRPVGGDPLPARARRRLLAAALAGFVLLALEVVWFRFLHLFVHSGSAAFAWMLATVLAGIGLGGAAGGAWLRRDPEAGRHAAGVACASGAGVALLYAGFDVLGDPAAASAAAPASILRLCGVLAFPVALGSGLLFPLIGASLQHEVTPETRATGLLTLWNTCGAALGSLAGGFLLLPGLGVGAFALRPGARLRCGGVAGAARGARAGLASVGARRGLAGGARGVSLRRPAGRVPADPRAPLARWYGARGGRAARGPHRDRRVGGAAPGRRASQPVPPDRQLLDVRHGRDVPTLHEAVRLLAGGAAPAPRRALLISYGVGSTAAALVATESLEQIDVVDISRDIVALVRRPVPRSGRASTAGSAGEGPHRGWPLLPARVLADTPYDLITSRAAAAEERGRRESLHPGVLRADPRASGPGRGHDLLAAGPQPARGRRPVDREGLLRGVADCTLWVGHDLNWMLAGTRRPPRRPLGGGLHRPVARSRVRPELERLGFGRPELLGATFLADAPVLRAWVADAETLTPPGTGAARTHRFGLASSRRPTESELAQSADQDSTKNPSSGLATKTVAEPDWIPSPGLVGVWATAFSATTASAIAAATPASRRTARVIARACSRNFSGGGGGGGKCGRHRCTVALCRV